MIFFTGFYANIGLFIYQAPEFECSKKIDQRYQYVSCTEKEACGEFKGHYRIKSCKFESIVNHFHLYCDKKDIVYVMKNTSLFFASITSFIVGFLSDFIGRQRAMLLAFLFAVMSFFIMFFSSEYSWIIIGNCFSSGYLYIMIMILFMYFNEVLTDPLRSRTAGILTLAYILGQMSKCLPIVNIA